MDKDQNQGQKPKRDDYEERLTHDADRTWDMMVQENIMLETQMLWISAAVLPVCFALFKQFLVPNIITMCLFALTILAIVWCEVLSRKAHHLRVDGTTSHQNGNEEEAQKTWGKEKAYGKAIKLLQWVYVFSFSFGIIMLAICVINKTGMTKI